MNFLEMALHMAVKVTVLLVTLKVPPMVIVVAGE